MKKGKILLIIANVVVGFAIYLSLKDREKKEMSFEEILISTLSNLKSLEIHPDNFSKTIKIEKKSNNWSVVEPFVWNSNNLALSNFQTKLSHLSATKLYEISELRKKGEIIEDYGITENSPSIKIADSSSHIELKFGSSTRNKNNLYSLIHISRLNKKFIFKLDSDISTFFKTQVIDWTENSFIKTPLYAIDNLSISFENKDGLKNTTSLEKQEEEWHFTQPFLGKADTERVLLLLNSLISANIIDYENESNDLNSSSKKWRAELSVSGFNRTENFVFQENKDGKIWGQSNGTETKFILDQSFLSQLNDWSTRLRSRTIFDFSLQRINELEISQENKKVKISKTENNSWVVGETNGSEMEFMVADENEIQTFFREINSATIEQFLSIRMEENSSIEDDGGSTIFTVNTIDNDSNFDTYLFSRTTDEDKIWTVNVKDRSLLCLVERDFNSLLGISALDFRSKNILPENYKFTELRLSKIDSNESRTIKLENDTQPYNILSNFMAESFISKEFIDDGVWIAGDWIPWNYQLSFTTGDTNNTQTYDFKLSERKGATTWYGGDQSTNLIFNLPINIIDDLDELFKSIE